MYILSFFFGGVTFSHFFTRFKPTNRIFFYVAVFNFFSHVCYDSVRFKYTLFQCVTKNNIRTNISSSSSSRRVVALSYKVIVVVVVVVVVVVEVVVVVSNSQ